MPLFPIAFVEDLNMPMMTWTCPCLCPRLPLLMTWTCPWWPKHAHDDLNMPMMSWTCLCPRLPLLMTWTCPWWPKHAHDDLNMPMMTWTCPCLCPRLPLLMTWTCPCVRPTVLSPPLSCCASGWITGTGTTSRTPLPSSWLTCSSWAPWDRPVGTAQCLSVHSSVCLRGHSLSAHLASGYVAVVLPTVCEHTFSKGPSCVD